MPRHVHTRYEMTPRVCPRDRTISALALLSLARSARNQSIVRLAPRAIKASALYPRCQSMAKVQDRMVDADPAQ